jgi:hypothetical protein
VVVRFHVTVEWSINARLMDETGKLFHGSGILNNQNELCSKRSYKYLVILNDFLNNH